VGTGNVVPDERIYFVLFESSEIYSPTTPLSSWTLRHQLGDIIYRTLFLFLLNLSTGACMVIEPTLMSAIVERL